MAQVLPWMVVAATVVSQDAVTSMIDLPTAVAVADTAIVLEV